MGCLVESLNDYNFCIIQDIKLVIESKVAHTFNLNNNYKIILPNISNENIF